MQIYTLTNKHGTKQDWTALSSLRRITLWSWSLKIRPWTERIWYCRAVSELMSFRTRCINEAMLVDVWSFFIWRHPGSKISSISDPSVISSTPTIVRLCPVQHVCITLCITLCPYAGTKHAVQKQHMIRNKDILTCSQKRTSSQLSTARHYKLKK